MVQDRVLAVPVTCVICLVLQSDEEDYKDDPLPGMLHHAPAMLAK